MSFPSWLRSLKSSHEPAPRAPRRSKRPHRPKRRPGLRVEILEDRTVPSTFTVVNTGDNGGVNPAPGAGTGTLRQAIVDADAAAGTAAMPDLIQFNIPTTDPGYNATTCAFTIAPFFVLPNITDTLVLDGYSQPGASPNALAVGDNAVLKIELDGRNVDPYLQEPIGLKITANNCAVQGLDIHGFDTPDPFPGPSDAIQTGVSAGIYILDSNDTRIQGNFIGTNVSGMAAPNGLPNYSASGVNGPMTRGVLVYGGTNNCIGSTGSSAAADAASRNIISANGTGVGFEASHDNVVAGNYIGTDKNGTADLGNWEGIGYEIGCSGDRVGTNGTDNDPAGEANLVSANVFGILFVGGDYLHAAETDAVVEGNVIEGNLEAGIGASENSSDIQVGGTNADQANTIADNHGPGVWVGYLPRFNGSQFVFLEEGATGIRVQGNSIYGNAGLGIDLGGVFGITGPDGVTPNDQGNNWVYTYPGGPFSTLIHLDSYGDGIGLSDQMHTGPNLFQNFPNLDSAASSGTSTVISGSFSQADEHDQIITVDFYANSSVSHLYTDGQYYGEGETYLGSTTISTDDTGYASFTAEFPVGTAGEAISATATDQYGNTSEFSADVPSSTTSLNINTNPATFNDALSKLSQSDLGPVSVYVNLGPGDYKPQTVQVPSGMTLYINGVLGATIDPDSPAFTVVSGNVIVSNLTFVTTGDAPTILVTGGSLTLRNDTIQESTGASDPAIAVTGGTVDLGTATDPGGNTINVNGTGAGPERHIHADFRGRRFVHDQRQPADALQHFRRGLGRLQ